MQKIIVFTDIHILPEGGTIIGLDPAARFAQGLAHALDRHPDADRIGIMNRGVVVAERRAGKREAATDPPPETVSTAPTSAVGAAAC